MVSNGNFSRMKTFRRKWGLERSECVGRKLPQYEILATSSKKFSRELEFEGIVVFNTFNNKF